MSAFKSLDLFLGGTQTAGTTTALADASCVFNYIDEGSTLEFKTQMTEINQVAGNAGLQIAVPGTSNYEFAGSVSVTATANSKPHCDVFLSACGLDGTMNPSSYDATYSPTHEGNYKAVTMLHYAGDKVASQSLKKSAKNMMFEGSFEGKIGEPLKLKLKGQGVVNAVPTYSTHPATVTATEEIIPVLKKINMTIVGSIYKISEFTIDPGYKVALIKDGSEYGFSQATLVPGPARWTAKCLYEGSVNPFTALIGASVDDFEISYGVSDKIVRFASDSSSQITEVTESDEAGIRMFNLKGHFVNNNWVLYFNQAA
jgi:hypothetical protein